MLNQGYYAPTHLTANGLVLTGPGILGHVNINTKGASASVVTIYDAVAGSGAVIAIIDALNQTGSYTYECSVANGIYVTITGSADVTISWGRNQ